jgi:hypothetical protein
MQTTSPTQTIEVGAPLEQYRVGYRSVFSGWPSAHAAQVQQLGHLDWCCYCIGRQSALRHQAAGVLDDWYAQELRSGEYGSIWLASLHGSGGGE